MILLKTINISTLGIILFCLKFSLPFGKLLSENVSLRRLSKGDESVEVNKVNVSSLKNFSTKSL